MADLTYNVPDHDDSELVAIAFCMLALRDLEANAAARVARYVADRYPAIAPDEDQGGSR